MKTYQKVLIGIAILLVIAYSAIHIYFTFYLEDQLRETLVEEVNSTAENQYTFDVADLSISLLGRSLQLEGVTLQTSESSTRQIEITIGGLAFSGVEIRNFLNNRNLVVNRVDIASPSISISGSGQADSGSELDNLTPRATEELLKVLNSISIPEISITSINFEVKRGSNSEPYFSMNETDLIFYNTRLDSSTTTDERILPIEDIEGTIRNSEFRTENGLYIIKNEKFEFSSINNVANAEGLELQPALSEEDFFEEVGYRTDRIEVTSPLAEFRDIRFDELIKMESFEMSEIILNEVDIRVFRNKHYPQQENRSEKKLPQQMLEELGFPIGIETVTLNDSYIRYTELEEHTDERGYVDFANLNATISNTTNIADRLNENPEWILEAETDVMDRARLNAKFVLPHRELTEMITGTLEPMDATELNRVLEPLALIRIDEGQIQSLNFDMELGSTVATGEVEVIYENLKISLLDEDSMDENLRTRVGSFFANTFAVKNDNSEDDPRIGEVSYERVPEKSVFNYWWKSLQSGLEASIGL